MTFYLIHHTRNEHKLSVTYTVRDMVQSEGNPNSNVSTDLTLEKEDFTTSNPPLNS